MVGKEFENERRDLMLNFFINMFTDTLEDEYQHYKQKYGDRVKLLEQGGRYTILNLLGKNPNIPSANFPPNRYNTNDIKILKRIYINICKNYEISLLPIREVE